MAKKTTSQRLRERLIKGFGVDIPETIRAFSHCGSWQSAGASWYIGKYYSQEPMTTLLKAKRLMLNENEVAIATDYLAEKYKNNPGVKLENID